MIRILKELERCAGTELLAKCFYKPEISQIVSSSLQEQHWNLHVKKMLATLLGWLPRWMKRKSQKHDAPHSGQRRGGLRLRSHPAAKRFAAGEKCQTWGQARCFQ